jgi:MFS family permease
MIEHLPTADRVHTYAISFVLGGVSGLASSWFLARVPEPAMQPGTRWIGLGDQLWAPFEDANFRRLLIFLGAWAIASNMAVPFLTVFLLRQLGYPLTVVTGLWVVSQIANALTLYAWGRLSDRLSNKAILAAALPVHFLSMFVLVFSDAIPHPSLQLALLAAVHVLMGIAGGGIGLATGNLGLKLAPQGHGTAYLASIGIVTAMCGGVTPIVAGGLAHWFEVSELSAVVRWVHSARTQEFTVVRFAHWEFLFALSALFGLYVMHALSRVREGVEVAEREVIQDFAFEAWRGVNSLSSLGGTVGAIFPFFDRLFDRIGLRGSSAARERSQAPLP